MTGAELIIKCLENEGVDTIFGYPGGAIIPFYDALYNCKTIEHILTVHEQGAAHAADGYARASGKVGVCVATSGPGATNLVTGLATAFLDSIPVVAITGQVARSFIGRDAFQEVDITGISMPITKHNFLVKNPLHLQETIQLAFEIAKSGRPGPVLIDIPRDIQTMEIAFDENKISLSTNSKENYCDNTIIDRTVELIQNSKRPVMLVGGGAVATEIQTELVRLAENTNIPVASTLMGLGAFPGDHDLFLGLSGLHGHERANKAISESDVLLAVGSRFNDRVTGDRKLYSELKSVIHIDIDPAEIDKNICTGIGLTGNIKEIIQKINKKITAITLDNWWNIINDCSNKNGAIKGTLAPYFMKALHEAIKENDEQTIVVTDVGQHQMWAAQHLKINKPRHWITSGGLGTMGFGTPAAIGAQLSRKNKRVVCISGDGGFKMTSNELYTIKRHKLPIINIVLNNSGLGMIRQLQQVLCENRFISCDLPANLDFVAYANAFGIQAKKVSTPEDFKRVVLDALKTREPYLVEAIIESSDMVKPMVNMGAGLTSYVKFPLPPV